MSFVCNYIISVGGEGNLEEPESHEGSNCVKMTDKAP